MVKSILEIDTLFLTPSFAVVFEVKNIAGSLKFIETPPQLIRTSADGQIDGFDSPAAQVERNVELLEEWIHIRGIHLPVYGVVVFAYPKQIVELAPVKTKVLFPKLIPSYIKSLYDKPSKLKKDSFNWLSTEIMSSHRNYIPPPICETYHIPRSDIRTGVACEFCGNLGMIKVLRNWRCSSCENYEYHFERK
ncbi:nuclease-related domain-containing protein [Bacillus methanolicus]|uniref:nuclease-related domain-containing protein n=1 Tax=Bacillus methanolicus TaxID=1471 RepID=UPI00238038DA|nr:nuclease-related domain-containing protein [Bacillus methanolicus]